MAENSGVEWCRHTHNEWMGCTRVSQGCVNCYAEAIMDHRLGKVEWGPGKPRVLTSEQNRNKPYRWNREAEQEGVRYRVFCSSLSDVFDSEVPESWRVALFKKMEETPFLDWLVLTKRPENIALYAPLRWFANWPANVWIGATIENQEALDRRLPDLAQVPAPVRFLSCEPLLGPLDLARWLHGRCPYQDQTPCGECGGNPGDCNMSSAFDWIICGGESGNGEGVRPMHPDWARSLRDQCARYDVPFFFKQWGAHVPATREDLNKTGANMFPIASDGRRKPMTEAFDPVQGDVFMLRSHKKKTGRILDGELHSEYPVPALRPSRFKTIADRAEVDAQEAQSKSVENRERYWATAALADGVHVPRDDSDDGDESW